ncbi:hypothetical protein C8C89_3209 [Janthinobacterium sp. 75]|nr:hypothetical protein C8C89_3209 [Janthinobacterium sp. 75]
MGKSDPESSKILSLAYDLSQVMLIQIKSD